MKKITIICLLFFVLSISSCTGPQQPIDLPDEDFIASISLSQESADDILTKSDGTIAFISDEVIAYNNNPPRGYDFSTDFTVVYNSVAREFDNRNSIPNEYEYLLMGYEPELDIIYYIEKDSANPVYRSYNNFSSDLDYDADNWYPSVITRRFKYAGIDFYVLGNEIITFLGEKLFTSSDTIVYPYNYIDQDMHFYTYGSDNETNQGCVIKSYNDLSGNPETSSLVHSSYTCDEDYSIKGEYVIIKLYVSLAFSGFAVIAPDGEIYTLDFAQEFTDFYRYVDSSLSFFGNNIILFHYIDNDREEHGVITNYFFNYFQLTSEYVEYTEVDYIDDEYYLDLPNLYKDDSLLYTHNSAEGSRLTTYTFDDDYILFYDFSNYDLLRITFVDANSGDHYFIESGDIPISGSIKIGTDLICNQGDHYSIYDIVAHEQVASMEIQGNLSYVNEEYIITDNDEYVYLYNLATKNIYVTEKIANYYEGFLVKYNEEFYIIG